MNQNSQTVQEYRANIVLKTERGISRCTIVSTNEEVLQNQIRQLLPDQSKPEVKEQGAMALLFHPKLFNGSEPFGWITEYAVPVHLGVENSTKQAGGTAASASGR